MKTPMTLSHSNYFIAEENPITIERRHNQDYFPLHNHDFDEIVIVCAGNGIHVWNNRVYPITAGDVLYINHSDVHAYETVDQLKLDNILYRREKLTPNNILFDYLPDERLTEQQRHTRINLSCLQELQALVAQLEAESKKTNQSSIYLAETLFTQLILLLDRYSYTETVQDSDEQKMDKLFTALSQHIDTAFNLENFCGQNNLSASSLRRLFKQQTHMTIGQYLQRLRLCQTMTLLRNTQLSITEIAIKCGYEDSNYFSTVFRKETACSPSEYRAQFMQKH
ncbi:MULTISPECIES: helix-turn-helix domain-containing protein [Pasteurellaceae]|uniref:helix-turn-helix domain-containing protein n=1 Tax=Pasteurellaceae TaxID=712 RepID=UPI0035691C94